MTESFNSMILYNIKEGSINIGIAQFMYCLMACHGLIRGKTMIKAMFDSFFIVIVKCTLSSLPRWRGNLLYQRSKLLVIKWAAGMPDRTLASKRNYNDTTWRASLKDSLLYGLCLMRPMASATLVVHIYC